MTDTTTTDPTADLDVQTPTAEHVHPASSHMTGAVQLAEWVYARALDLAEAEAHRLISVGTEDSNGLPAAYIAIEPNGVTHTIDVTAYRAEPVAVVENRVLRDVTSFAQYVDRHKTARTTIWATGDTVHAILDDHAATDGGSIKVPGAPGWKRHRATLKLDTAPEWAAWKTLHRQFVTQEQFAEVVEEFAGTLIDPDAEEMLLVAQSITVLSSGQVSSSVSLRDGALNLNVTETLEASAGTRDVPLRIPARLRFTARRWLGVPPTELSARLRYRVQRGKLSLGLVIDRLEDVEDQYNRSLVGSLSEATLCPVYIGTA